MESAQNVTCPEETSGSSEEGKLLSPQMGFQELINQTTNFYQDFSDKDNNKLIKQAKKKKVKKTLSPR